MTEIQGGYLREITCGKRALIPHSQKRRTENGERRTENAFAQDWLGRARCALFVVRGPWSVVYYAHYR